MSLLKYFKPTRPSPEAWILLGRWLFGSATHPTKSKPLGRPVDCGARLVVWKDTASRAPPTGQGALINSKDEDNKSKHTTAFDSRGQAPSVVKVETIEDDIIIKRLLDECVNKVVLEIDGNVSSSIPMEITISDSECNEPDPEPIKPARRSTSSSVLPSPYVLPSPTTSSSSGKARKDSHRRIGYNTAWEKEFPWLELQNGAMICNNCSSAGLDSAFSKSSGGSRNYRRDKILQHQSSKGHKSAIQKLKTVQHTKSDILEPVLTFKEKNFKVALRAIWFILRENLAFAKYEPILDLLAEISACSSKGDLPANANLRSERLKTEMIGALGNAVSESVLEKIRAGRCFSLMIDETTDISTTEQMIIYAKYPDHSELKTSFLGIVELQGGSAKHIFEKVCSFLTGHNLDLNKMAGFGSDGASVMVGKTNGVAALLKAENGKIVSIHCVAHRLALAVSGAAKANAAVNLTLSTLDKIHSYYSKSTVRTSKFRQIQEALGAQPINLVQASATRWLSYDKAVANARRVLPELLISLESEAVDKGCPKAQGFVKYHLSDLEFLMSLETLHLVLPKLADLSRKFQESNLGFGAVGTHVKATLLYIREVQSSKYPDVERNVAELIRRCAEAGVKHVPQISEESLSTYKRKVFHPFLEAVCENLDSRFPQTSIKIVDDAAVFSSLDIPVNFSNSYGVNQITDLAEHYHLDREDTLSEWDIARHALVVRKTEPNTIDSDKGVTGTLRWFNRNFSHLNNLSYITNCLSIIIVSTADCERGFSLLKLVKTPLRNALGAKNLNNAMHVSLNGTGTFGFWYGAAKKGFVVGKKRRVI